LASLRRDGHAETPPAGYLDKGLLNEISGMPAADIFMDARPHTVAVEGVEGQCALWPGVPSFSTFGLPSKATTKDLSGFVRH